MTPSPNRNDRKAIGRSDDRSGDGVKVRNVLLIYKKSAYQIHVLEHENPFFRRSRSGKESFEERRLRLSHELHRETIREVRRVLDRLRIRTKTAYRSSKVDVGPYDLVISVGGDGTFLKAARDLKKQILLGVNSDPAHSVGSFCATDRSRFRKLFEAVLRGAVKPQKLNRLELRVNGRLLPQNVLNDILFCHRNPAAMSRYWIKIGSLREEHRNSGLWISTAAGSTGGIQSAGGRVLPWGSRKIQYWPREMVKGRGLKQRLRGGFVPAGRKLILGSMIREGGLYLDGAHLKVPFSYGDVLEVSNSRFPLNCVLPAHR